MFCGVLGAGAPCHPLCQSYEAAYAKMVPVRLNAVHEMGACLASKAVMSGEERRKLLLVS